MHNQKNTIDQPSRKPVQLLPFVKDKALATKDMEVTNLGCATVHQLITGFLLVHSDVDLVRNIARAIQCLIPEPSQIPMLIKHRPSHLTQGSVFPFHNTILGRRIRTRKLVFKTQVMAKGSKREFLNSEPLSLRIAHMAYPCLLFLNLKTRSRTKPNISRFSSGKNTHANRE
jgi:hypothetical protein